MFLDWVLKVTVAFSHTYTCWEWEGREQRWSHSCQMNMLQKSKIEIDYKSLIASSLYETKVSPAVLINKNCHSHQWLLASRCNEGSQTVVQWMLRPRQEDCWGAGRMQSNKVIKQTELAPDSWGAYERNEFWVQRLVSSHTENAKCLDTWSLMFRLPALFVANLYVAWLPLLPPWSSFLRATEMLSPRLGVVNIPTK